MKETVLDNIDNNEDLISKIRELQKEVDQLNAQLKEKRFGLTWIDVPEAFEKESENKIPVLEEVPELAIHNDDGKPTHILIEGDNYHALTCLNYTHHGKVDIIYIDPPYNTGSDDFVYKDKRFLEQFPDGTPIPLNHPLRHSTWLSFMKKRLSLAFSLLSDKGVLFISIDDNEQARLKLLCDQLFGESSYVTTLIVESSVIAGPRRVPAMQGSVVKTAEFCLVYTKKNDRKIMKNLKYDFIEGFDTHYSKWVDEENGEIISFNDLLRREKKIAEVFNTYKLPININNLNKILILNEDVKKWLYSDKIASHLYRQGDKEDIDTGVAQPTPNQLFRIENKWYVTTEEGTFNVFRYIDRIGKCDDYFNSFGERSVRGNLWKGFSSDGGNLDKEGGISFKGGKKPIRLIKQLIDAVCSSDKSIILDFFAGSGTTMHATMELNNKDGGHRQCILCQINESDICRKKTYERARKVILGYKENKKVVHGLGNSLKYYHTAFVGKNQPKSATDDDKLTLAKKAGCLLGLAENTLYEKEVSDYYQFYADERGQWTCIYFQEDYSHFEEFRKKVVELEGKEKSVYVFCWTDGSEFAAEFEFEKNITVKSIPQPILNIYKSLNA